MSAELHSAAFGGTHNAQQILADALGKASKIAHVVVCAKYSDGSSDVAWSDGDIHEFIGMAAHAQHVLCQQLENT